MRHRARSVSVTILVDNLIGGGSGVLAEHGLCLHAEVDGRQFLLDTGQSGVFLGNAAKLGLDLTPARKVVLSHAHYDHTGALPLLLAAFGPREILAHPAIFAEKFARRSPRRRESIGLRPGVDDLRRLGAVLRLEPGPQEIAPGVITTGAIARTNKFEDIPTTFQTRDGKRFRQDLFEDENAIIIQSQRGLVVLVGCAHRGVINTIHHAIELTGDDRVRAVIGGTHLGPASARRVSRTIEELRRLDVQRVVASHCTGFWASAKLAQALGKRFDPGGSGFRIEL